MKSKRLVALAAAAAVLAVPAIASAAPETHDGFMLRLALGAAGLSASDSTTPTIKWSGGGAILDIALGGIVAPNLAIQGEIAGMAAIGPKIQVGDITATTSSDASAGMSFYGVGVTYFVMPVNLYVSGSIGASRFSFSYNPGGFSSTVTAASNFGLGVNLMLGKEWWVSENWGLGVAGQFMFGSAKDSGFDATQISGGALGIALSATYN